MVAAAIVGNVLLSLCFFVGSFFIIRYRQRFLSPRLAVLFGVVFALSGIEHVVDAQAFYFNPNPIGAGMRLAMVPMVLWLVLETAAVVRDRDDG